MRMLNNNYYQRTADKISCDLIIIKLNKYKMNKEKLIDSIIELACELDRGDIKLDELVNKAYALVKKDRAEQLILSGVSQQREQLIDFVKWFETLSAEELVWYDGKYAETFMAIN